MTGTAQRYARAFFEAVRDEEGLQQVLAALTGDARLWEALTSPAVRPAEKKAVLSRLEVFRGRQTLLHGCCLLCDRGRMGLLPRIAEAYHALGLESRNAAEAVMTCVRPPDGVLQDQIKQMLCTLHRRDEILLDIRLDPALLGGFTLELEGVRYDNSVRGRLERLGRHLQERRTV